MDDPIQQLWNQIDETTIVLWDQLDETTTAYTGFPATTAFVICILLYSIWLLLGPAFDFLFSGGVGAIDRQGSLTRTLTPTPVDQTVRAKGPLKEEIVQNQNQAQDLPKVEQADAQDPPETQWLDINDEPPFDDEDTMEPPRWYDLDETPLMPSATTTTTSINTQHVVMTEEMLLQYNGINQLYVAVLGDIFDVSERRDLYGPGKAYEIFAGKHISRALAKWSLAPENRTGYTGDLSRSEIKRLDHWKRKFDRKYTKVGSIYGPH